MTEENTNFVIAFCTGQLVKFDMAVNALKEAEIAHQVRTETATGLKLAMPTIPDPGPGQFFTLLVPADSEAKTKAVLSELPFEITTNPGAWDFEPRPAVKRWWKVVSIGTMMLFALLWGMKILGLLR